MDRSPYIYKVIEFLGKSNRRNSRKVVSCLIAKVALV
ncbi:hypothetical protein M7I_0806 [Glarea lozoyensis 74030]|uniref:Uncharacterized protein n=1 Tax=Glarea lozoyensis (strain ATCC 74030 / MF5533) TaxID=1104152 RepID=H0EED1_GLAL7|nr:hypothetical protein M7I_0806 [Glarea lozoyensis 74030]